MKRAKPQPPVDVYFFEFLTMNSIRGGAPGLNAPGNSGIGSRFHASFADFTLRESLRVR